MSMLVDLPKPLDEYQEKELKGRTVCYDVAGWPVHPDSGERSVRILSLKTEFCLNLIFFLAYPLALILRLCSLCCCIKNGGDDDETCYKRVNIIRCKADKKNSRPEVDRYYDNDLREASDTHYVIQCMKESQLSLEKLHNSFS
ncbi:uncharacterized protein LOC115880293 isoform X2 [Sitophilus oryzae]|nr:uncharacterized protein LOC115880293 isoform X2 [Sitophilus oryzae]